MNQEVSFLTLPDRKLAFQQQLGDARLNSQKPVLFLSGYASDMMGTKASFLAEKCKAAGRGFLRFDYRGHGQSSGEFVDGTIGAWFEDALAVFDQLTEGPQVLVGSSMGGWIALLLARARPERVAGLVGLSAAPDFTEELVVPNLTFEQKEQLAREGLFYEETVPPYPPVPITRRLIEEARGHLVMKASLKLEMPAHLIHGQKDAEVPWQLALKLAECLTSPSVRITLIKDGSHRLSRPEDLELVWSVIQTL